MDVALELIRDCRGGPEGWLGCSGGREGRLWLQVDSLVRPYVSQVIVNPGIGPQGRTLMNVVGGGAQGCRAPTGRGLTLKCQ